MGKQRQSAVVSKKAALTHGAETIRHRRDILLVALSVFYCYNVYVAVVSLKVKVNKTLILLLCGHFAPLPPQERS